MIRPSVKFVALLDNETQPMNDLSLIGLKGPAWRVARKAFESAIMHKDALALHLEVMEQCVARLLARLARITAAGEGDGAIVNVAPLMGDLTMDVVGSCAFGVAFNTQEKELGKAALLGAGGQDLGSQQQCLPYGPEELVDACHNAFATSKVGGQSRWTTLALLLPEWCYEGLRWLACRFPDPPQRVSLHTRKVIVGTAKALIKAWEQDQAEAAVATAAAASHHASKGGVSAAEQSGVKAGGRVHEKSFLGLLLKGRDLTTGTTLDLQQVMAQIHVFLLAGYETTATALTFALYLLAANPEAQRKLQVEVDSQGELLALPLNTLASTVAKGADCDPVAHQQAHARPAARPELAPAGAGLTAEEVAASFPYACAVLDEAMRLYPPAATALRSPSENIEVAGYRIPAHTFLYMPIYSYHHDADVWPDVAEFKPERHLVGHPDAMDAAAKASFMPFGHGARSCPGARFAMQEARVALVRMVRQFSFELAPMQEHPVRTWTGLTTTPVGGMWLRVHNRTCA
ncbi:cytochrome P450 [Haematococcus lacustris]